MDDLLRGCGCRPDFALEFVKYGQYSPHSSTKSVSAPRPLATVPILGQPPSAVTQPPHCPHLNPNGTLESERHAASYGHEIVTPSNLRMTQTSRIDDNYEGLTRFAFLDLIRSGHYLLEAWNLLVFRSACRGLKPCLSVPFLTSMLAGTGCGASPPPCFGSAVRTVTFAMPYGPRWERLWRRSFRALHWG